MRTVNGAPGVVVRASGFPLSVLTFDIADGKFATVRSVVNPDKLAHLRR